MTEKLIFPKGEFTHADLAAANSKTKQSVYNQFQAAIKDGTIIFCGEKSSGRGKPSKLYMLNDGARPAKPEVATVKQVEVTVAADPEIKKDILNLPNTVIVPVLTVPNVIQDIEPEKPIENIPADIHEIEDVCPICKKKLYAWRYATGVMVKCLQSITICPSIEHPFHHGRSVKDAVAGMERWKEYMKPSNV